MFFAEGYTFPSDVDGLILHPHHVCIEFLHHIYESWSFMFIEQMPSFAFNQLLELRNPFVKTSFPNEVFILQYISPSNISHIGDPVTSFLFAALCFFISSFSFPRFFHCLLKFFVYLSPFFTLPYYCLSGLNCFNLQLSVFFHDFVEVWNQVQRLRHYERVV